MATHIILFVLIEYCPVNADNNHQYSMLNIFYNFICSTNSLSTAVYILYLKGLQDAMYI